MRDRDSRYNVDTALLNVGIIPEHLRDAPDRTGPGETSGIFHPPGDGPIIVWCERRGCSEGFEWRGNPEDLKEELRRRGWGFNEHYTEDQARPVRRELHCPEHV